MFALGAMLVPALAALAAFKWGRLQFDALSPALAMLALFATLLALTLGEASRERRDAAPRDAARARAVGAHLRRDGGRAARPGRDAAARRRVRATSGGSTSRRRWCRRARSAATSTTSSGSTGGGWFFLVGDVAGKGLSASIFMAVSKALAKSAAVRHPDDDVGAWMTAANREISRENSEGLFVTLFAGILDLDTGDLVYANAGPRRAVLRRQPLGLRRPRAGGGPPLCTVDDFEYRGEHTFLDPDELVVLTTDGITDMRNPAGRRCTAARASRRCSSAGASSRQARRTSSTRCASDVLAFAAGADPPTT